MPRVKEEKAQSSRDRSASPNTKEVTRDRSRSPRGGQHLKEKKKKKKTGHRKIVKQANRALFKLMCSSNERLFSEVGYLSKGNAYGLFRCFAWPCSVWFNPTSSTHCDATVNTYDTSGIELKQQQIGSVLRKVIETIVLHHNEYERRRCAAMTINDDQMKSAIQANADILLLVPVVV